MSLLKEPFNGRELYTYYREHVSFRTVTIADWEELRTETQQRWNRMAAMINKRMQMEQIS